MNQRVLAVGISLVTSLFLFTGSAAAGSRVELFEGLTSLGTATAAADGSFSVDIDLAVGTHEIFARAMDVAGNVGPSSNEMTITVIDETQLAASLASNSFG